MHPPRLILPGILSLAVIDLCTSTRGKSQHPGPWFAAHSNPTRMASSGLRSLHLTAIMSQQNPLLLVLTLLLYRSQLC